MNSNAYLAYAKLKALGAPVHPAGEHRHAQFIMGAELRNNEDKYYADYYGYTVNEQEINDCGDEYSYRVHEKGPIIINVNNVLEDVWRILREHNLMAEWINPGTVGIYNV